eukprot:scaffold34129_cov51-Attheya_sp.AAC.4
MASFFVEWSKTGCCSLATLKQGSSTLDSVVVIHFEYILVTAAAVAAAFHHGIFAYDCLSSVVLLIQYSKLERIAAALHPTNQQQLTPNIQII